MRRTVKITVNKLNPRLVFFCSIFNEVHPNLNSTHSFSLKGHNKFHEVTNKMFTFHGCKTLISLVWLFSSRITELDSTKLTNIVTTDRNAKTVIMSESSLKQLPAQEKLLDRRDCSERGCRNYIKTCQLAHICGGIVTWVTS